MAHGIAKQFGTSCEVVIHDLNKDLETSIVHIENGQVTHRKSGDGPSGIVLETLHKNAAKVQDKLSYLTRTEDGRILKSSTLYIRDADEKISYIFSINYDITALLTIDSALGSLLHTEPETDTYTVSKPHSPQTITRNVEELLNDLMQQGVALVGKPVALMTKEDKIQVVAQQLEITHLLERHPYDLSGGEQQRAAIGKVLLLEPRLLLLDEPTKGIDAWSKRQLGNLLKDLRGQGITVLMVTHDVEFAAEVSDRCGLFFDHEITSVDTPEEFFCNNNYYTTAANRISRQQYENAITCEEVIELCRQNGRKSIR